MFRVDKSLFIKLLKNYKIKHPSNTDTLHAMYKFFFFS